jgi:hypothetical protein
MFSAELKDLILRVIKSWEVLTVTGVLILYMFLVSYVARIYHRPRLPGKAPKKKGKEKAAGGEADVEPAADDDDLGLEEKE